MGFCLGFYFRSVVRVVLELFDLVQIVFQSDQFEHLAIGDHLFGVPLVAIEWHVLDKSHIYVLQIRNKSEYVILLLFFLSGLKK
jgi:hypothetical protein